MHKLYPNHHKRCLDKIFRPLGRKVQYKGWLARYSNLPTTGNSGDAFLVLQNFVLDNQSPPASINIGPQVYVFIGDSTDSVKKWPDQGKGLPIGPELTSELVEEFTAPGQILAVTA